MPTYLAVTLWALMLVATYHIAATAGALIAEARSYAVVAR